MATEAQIPDKPGFYWACCNRIGSPRFGAILEIFGDPPFMRTALHRFGQEESELVDPNLERLVIGPRIPIPDFPDEHQKPVPPPPDPQRNRQGLAEVLRRLHAQELRGAARNILTQVQPIEQACAKLKSAVQNMIGLGD